MLIDIAIVPIDFHPYWHITRLPIGFEYLPPPPIILDPIERSIRRSKEAERRAHLRANNRLRIAQTGRILSSFEQTQGPQRHCSACTEHGHDKQAYSGYRSTGYTRSNCPYTMSRALSILPQSTRLLYNTPVQNEANTLAHRRAIQLLTQRTQQWWEENILASTQSDILGPEMEVLDTSDDVLVLATQLP